MSVAANGRQNDGVDLASLIAELHDDPLAVGRFEPIATAPRPADDLLNHDGHMTLTVERHHGGPVDVAVARSVTRLADGTRIDGPSDRDPEALSYTREITLTHGSEASVVMYGIVRLDVTVLSPEVWLKIVGRGQPLGRVLIEHDVMRQVKLCQLWAIDPGPSMIRIGGFTAGRTAYGRTASIRLNGRPAIELLEVVRLTDLR